MQRRWVSKSITTHQGTFTVRWPFHHSWWFTPEAWIEENGVIQWKTMRPRGVLMRYPDGTKRFIKLTKPKDEPAPGTPNTFETFGIAMP